MGIFDFFNFEKKIGGMIAQLGLQELYKNSSESQKQAMRDMLDNPYQLGTNYTSKDLISGTNKWLDSKVLFLSNTAGHAKNDDDKIFFFNEAFKQNPTHIEKHFLRQSFAEFYYRIGDYEKCEQLCLDDIADYNKYVRYLKYKDGLASVKSFHRLAIMYEKQGRYNEAINISKQALKKKQHDGTKKGYEGRIEKLQRKINKVTRI